MRRMTGRRWLMLAAGIAAQAATSVVTNGTPYLAPTMRTDLGLSLGHVGVLVACPLAGAIATLVAWGAAADRVGEKRVLVLGVGLCGIIVLATTVVRGVVPLGVLLVLAGAASGSVSSASGRLVLGWFGTRERGLAMGLRQTALPLGMGLAALILPPLAERWGLYGALPVAGALCVVVALVCAFVLVDPPRPAQRVGDGGAPTGSPYRKPTLWRVHAASALLVMPQFTVGAFGLVFLVDVRSWSPATAGQLLAATQVLGAASRIGAGYWSDRVGSRLRPMRLLAVGNAVIVASLGLFAVRPSWVTATVLVVASVVTVAGNGLAFTATAELAGPQWAGRALGVQNTAQSMMATATPPLVGVLVTVAGSGGSAYAYAFWLAACFAAAAVPVTPAGAGRSRASRPSP
ncbi:MAG: MFS transporter [Streptosporangiales bacterium]|nr:MFS transporter [Streptosporangiales bacterium]